jgi:hypothetical protein
MSGKTKTTATTEVTEVQAQQVETAEQQATTQTSGENDGTQQPAQSAKTFTQAELNTIIQQRLEQERRKFADYDTLKQQLTTLQAGQQSQQQQSAERLQQLEQQNQQLAVVSKEKTIEAAVAKAAGVIGLDPEAALKLADLKALTVDEAGNVLNAADVVKAVGERFPGLLKRPMPVASAVNAPAGAALTPEQKEAQFHREFFGGGAKTFFGGGGVVLPVSLFDE